MLKGHLVSSVKSKGPTFDSCDLNKNNILLSKPSQELKP